MNLLASDRPDDRRDGAAWIGMIGVIGWVFTTWLRIKHGYPLDGAWGQAVYPKKQRRDDRAGQAAQPGECPAPRRAGRGQGPARQCRADRHRRQPPPDAGDRSPARAEELSGGICRGRDRLHRHRPADDHDRRAGRAACFRHREKKLELEAQIAAEKAAREAAHRAARAARAGARADRHRQGHRRRRRDRAAADERQPEPARGDSKWISTTPSRWW